MGAFKLRSIYPGEIVYIWGLIECAGDTKSCFRESPHGVLEKTFYNAIDARYEDNALSRANYLLSLYHNRSITGRNIAIVAA